jgi:hypothetical protein
LEISVAAATAINGAKVSRVPNPSRQTARPTDQMAPSERSRRHTATSAISQNTAPTSISAKPLGSRNYQARRLVGKHPWSTGDHASDVGRRHPVPASRRATATWARSLPRRRAMSMPQRFSQARHCRRRSSARTPDHWQQALSFPTQVSERHALKGPGDPSARIVAWLQPRVGRKGFISPAASDANATTSQRSR